MYRQLNNKLKFAPVRHSALAFATWVGLLATGAGLNTEIKIKKRSIEKSELSKSLKNTQEKEVKFQLMELLIKYNMIACQHKGGKVDLKLTWWRENQKQVSGLGE